jgi:hypothetical protein
LIALCGWILAWVGINGAGMLSHAGRNHAIIFVTWTLAFAGFASLFFVLSAPARNRAWRSARRILNTEPWAPVEALVTTDPEHPSSDNRLVTFIDPRTGRPDRTMMVTQGGEHGWLQPLDRGWFVCAARADGRRAVLAPPDRRAVAQLDVPQQGTRSAERTRARMPVAGRPWGAPTESERPSASTRSGFGLRPS